MPTKIRTAQIGSGTLDMEFLGMAMVKHPQVLKELILSKRGRYALTTLLQAIQPESVKEEVLPSNLVKWQVLGIPTKIARVEGYSGTPTVGGYFDLIVNDGWFKAGAKVRLEDGYTMLYLDNDGIPEGEFTRYRAQLIGQINGTTMSDLTLLEKGRALNYVTANYEEGSDRSHPTYYGTGDWYMNAMSITRHGIDLTGSALTEATIYEMTDLDTQTGQEITFKGWLPNILTKTGESLVDFHLRARERAMHYDVANFDPVTGLPTTKAGHNGGRPVLMGDGLIAQMEDAFTLMYDPQLDSPAYIRSCIRNILSYCSYHWDQDFIDLYVIGGRGARMVFQDAMVDSLVTGGQTIFRTPDNQQMLVAGMVVEEFKTEFGTAKFVLDNAFDDPTQVTRKIEYNSAMFAAESFDMYFLPVKRLPSGQNNIRIFNKGKNVYGQEVNRSLVFAEIQGMTGYLAAAGLKGNQYKAAEQQLAAYSTMVSTKRDSHGMEVLSESMIILSDPSHYARLLAWRS